MMTTVRQIAELACVSICTVSKALRGDPCISAPTRERVMAIAEQLYYRPNRLAPELFAGTSSQVGVIVPKLGDWYESQILQGITQEAYRDGWNILIFEHHWIADLLDELFVQLIERRVQGIIVIPGILPFPQRYLEELRFRHIVPVGIDINPNQQEIDHVHTNDEAVAQLAVEYLLHLGHRRIGFVTMNLGARSSRDQAIRHELARRGLSAPQYQFHYRGHELSDHRRAYTDLLTRPPRPSAIITWNLALTLPCLQVARELGIRVPTDVSLLCCGDEAYSSMMPPALTSIELHPNDVGRQAFRLVLRRLQYFAENSKGSVIVPESIVIQPSLTVRASCQSV